MDESDARRWSEWDRHGRKIEMALVPSVEAIRISASLQDQGVAYLNAKITGHQLDVTDIFVQEQINYRTQGGFIGKNRAFPGRKSGYGSLLIRALVAFARRHGFKGITGIVLDRQVSGTPYLLEWFSKRGFIVEKVSLSTADLPGVAAAFRMLI